MIHSALGRNPNWAAKRGSDERPGSRDRGEVVSEDDPAVRRDVVATILEPFRGRLACRVEREH